MAPFQPIATHRSFLRGINAGTDKFDVPRGTLPRISNMLFTKRGSLVVIDGNIIVFGKDGGGPAASQGQIVNVEMFQATGIAPFYTFMQIDPESPLAVPTGLAVNDSNVGGAIAAVNGAVRASNIVTITCTGNHNLDPSAVGQQIVIAGVTDASFNGTFTIASIPTATTFTYAQVAANAASGNGTANGQLVPATTYGYRVSALDGIGGETTCAATVTRVLGGGQDATLITWAAVTNAAGYRVYGRTNGAELLMRDNLAATTFQDLGSIVPAGALPAANTTSQLILVKPSLNTGYTKPGDIVAYFTAGNVPALTSPTPSVNPPSGGTGGGPPIGGGGTGGGVVGCPIEGTAIEALGNHPLTVGVEEASAWITITTEHGHQLTAVPEHPVYVDGYGRTPLSLVELGDGVITKSGISRVIDKTSRMELRHKLVVSMPDGHLYWAGGILSHNLKPLIL